MKPINHPKSPRVLKPVKVDISSRDRIRPIDKNYVKKRLDTVFEDDFSDLSDEPLIDHQSSVAV
jgi:hypothetical protein